MATEVEEMRVKLDATKKDRIAFAATFNKDNLPTEDDERKLDAMLNGEADLEASIVRFEKFAKGTAGGGSSRPLDNEQNLALRPERQKIQTLGARFVANPEFLAALARYAPNGKIPASGGFQMPGMSFGGLADMSAALITGLSDTSGGAFVITDRQTELVTLGRRPLTVLDIIRKLQTSSDIVDYVAQTSRTNAAAIVAEATATDGSSGVKPESATAFVVRNAPVVTIPTWIPVTKQAVADVPQMRGIIDTELKDNLQEVLEDNVVNGTGQMVGITQTSGTQTQAWDTNILTTTRKAKTLVRTVGRTTPDYYVLNPTEVETIDLLQDNEARFYYGGPTAVMTPRLWGLPMVESEASAQGYGLVGNFQKCILWDREQASIAISDSHADFFIRNLLAILAELRAAFALVQPNAMVEIDVAA